MHCVWSKLIKQLVGFQMYPKSSVCRQWGPPCCFYRTRTARPCRLCCASWVM